MRQVVLDTETTGLEVSQGHRIIEIGCVELVDRRHTQRRFHQYLNPERPIDEGAYAVHGIGLEMLQDKPRFSDVVEQLLDFVRGAELVIHNAAFDVAFLNQELSLLGGALGRIADHCTVLDTLRLARERHPGQRNSLDALCKRYEVDNSQRELHGALLDARILADVYLAMTGGQTSLALTLETGDERASIGTRAGAMAAGRTAAGAIPMLPPVLVRRANAVELERHEQVLRTIDKSAANGCLWRTLEAVKSENDASH